MGFSHPPDDQPLDPPVLDAPAPDAPVLVASVLDARERDPAGNALAASMGYLVRRTFRAFTRALEQRLVKHGITSSMWYMLRLLWERDGLSQKELGEELALAPPTIASAIDTLEAKGLVRRERNQEDRRRLHIILSDKGRALEAELIGYASEVNGLALRDLEPAETEMLRFLLLRLTRGLDRENDGDPSVMVPQ